MTDSIAKEAQVQFVPLGSFDLHDVGTIVSTLARQLAKAEGIEPVTSHPYVELSGPGYILEVPFDPSVIDSSPKRFAIHIKQVDDGEVPTLILTWPAEADPDYKPQTSEA